MREPEKANSSQIRWGPQCEKAREYSITEHYFNYQILQNYRISLFLLFHREDILIENSKLQCLKFHIMQTKNAIFQKKVSKVQTMI